MLVKLLLFSLALPTTNCRVQRFDFFPIDERELQSYVTTIMEPKMFEQVAEFYGDVDHLELIINITEICEKNVTWKYSHDGLMTTVKAKTDACGSSIIRDKCYCSPYDSWDFEHPKNENITGTFTCDKNFPRSHCNEWIVMRYVLLVCGLYALVISVCRARLRKNKVVVPEEDLAAKERARLFNEDQRQRAWDMEAIILRNERLKMERENERKALLQV